MRKLIDTTEHLHSQETALTILAQLQASEEDGWTYAVTLANFTHNAYYVAAYDEDGEFVAKF